MASGFIILRDGRCLSVTHAAHDAVLHSIAAAMQDATPLHAWLLTQIPVEMDVESEFTGDHVVGSVRIR